MIEWKLVCFRSTCFFLFTICNVCLLLSVACNHLIRNSCIYNKPSCSIFVAKYFASNLILIFEVTILTEARPVPLPWLELFMQSALHIDNLDLTLSNLKTILSDIPQYSICFWIFLRFCVLAQFTIISPKFWSNNFSCGKLRRCMLLYFYIVEISLGIVSYIEFTFTAAQLHHSDDLI